MQVLVHFHDPDKNLVTVKGVYNPDTSEINSVHHQEWSIVGVTPLEDHIDISMKRKREEDDSDDDSSDDEETKNKIARHTDIVENYVEDKNNHNKLIDDYLYNNEIRYPSSSALYIRLYLKRRFRISKPDEDVVKGRILWNLCLYYYSIHYARDVPLFIDDMNDYYPYKRYRIRGTIRKYYRAKQFEWHDLFKAFIEMIKKSNDEDLMSLWVIWMLKQAPFGTMIQILEPGLIFPFLNSYMRPFSKSMANIYRHYADGTKGYEILYRDFINWDTQNTDSRLRSLYYALDPRYYSDKSIDRVEVVDYYYNLLRTDYGYESNKYLFAEEKERHELHHIYYHIRYVLGLFESSISYSLKLTVPIIKMYHWHNKIMDSIHMSSFIVTMINAICERINRSYKDTHFDRQRHKLTKRDVRAFIRDGNKIKDWYYNEIDLLRGTGFSITDKKRIDDINGYFGRAVKVFTFWNSSEFTVVVKELIKETSKSSDYKLSEIADLVISVFLGLRIPGKSIAYEDDMMNTMLKKMKKKHFSGLGQVAINAIRAYNPQIDIDPVSKRSVVTALRPFNSGFANVSIINSRMNKNTLLF